MIRIRDISMDPCHSVEQLSYEAAKLLRISASKLKALTIVRRSVDARKKPNVRIIYTVDVAVAGNEERILRSSGCKKAALTKYSRYTVPKTDVIPQHRPVVVGFGPAGMFAALILALSGLRPIILERGMDALTRFEKVNRFFETGQLDPQCNIQFGEGGAGTFSDGKLNTGVNNIRIDWILQQLVDAGAHENILYDAKPHVGTDVLLEVVQNIRRRIEALGAEVFFGEQVVHMTVNNGRINGIKTSTGRSIACSHVILAIGHSARDTFEMLESLCVPMERKPFAMGVRIEHKQEMIDLAQYGTTELPLPPADYKLVKHLQDGTVYTFCMCPGGYVVAAASEEGGVVTNGMSYVQRDGDNANSALLVTVNPSEFPFEGVLGGVRWQRQIEQRAYQASGSYRAPAQKVGDFLVGRKSEGPGSVQPSYRPGVYWCDLHDILPQKITAALKEALPLLDKNLAGFAYSDAVMTAPETRSSSPVRILRDDSRQSSVCGLFPCGEGAGYAGGIMSAAVDGILSAEAVIAAMEGKAYDKQSN